MGLLAWVIMGLALWHFTIWLPDRSWGGIVGAFIGALVGAALFGLIIHGFNIPGRHATHLTTALEGIPGALIGMALVYIEGIRRERAGAPPAGPAEPGGFTGPTSPGRPTGPRRPSRPGPRRAGPA